MQMGCMIKKPCSAGKRRCLGLRRLQAVCAAHHPALQAPVSYTKEFKEFIVFIGDGASELSGPSAVSLQELFPLYWPIKEPSSLNCPSPPSP